MKDFELYDNENWCASVEQGKKNFKSSDPNGKLE